MGDVKKSSLGGVRMVPNGPLVPWKEFCKEWGHYFRPDNTCICGKKKPREKK